MITCVDKKTKEEFIYLGLILGIPAIAGMTFWGIAAAKRRSIEEGNSHPHMPERPTPLYGTFAL